MRKIVAVALLAATCGLSGCVFAVGTSGEGERIQRLDERVSRAERALNIQPAPAEPVK